MEPTRELANALFRDKVLQARRTPPELRLLGAVRLSDTIRAVVESGVRAQHPDASEEQVRHELRRRLAIARRLEETTYEGLP